MSHAGSAVDGDATVTSGHRSRSGTRGGSAPPPAHDRSLHRRRLRSRSPGGRPVSELPPLERSGAPDAFARSYETYGATRLWQNVNVSPNLEAVARTIAPSATRALGEIDGVVSLTPEGLAALIGPERQLAVASWPASLRASNLAQVLEHDMYVQYEGESWHLRREVSYRVTLDPGDRSATGELVCSFVNKAPATGESADVIAPVARLGDPGANRQIALIVRSPRDRLTAFEVGGRPQPIVRAAEGGMVAYHAGVFVPSGDRTQLTLKASIPGALRSEHGELVYNLRILRQPVPHADFYDVRISAPPGWSVEGGSTFVGTLQSDLDVEVRLRRTLRARIAETLVLDPVRGVRDLFRRLF